MDQRPADTLRQSHGKVSAVLLTTDLIEQCRDWGRRIVLNYENGVTPASRELSWGGIERDPVEQARGKMGEVIACLQLGAGDPKTALSWHAKAGDADGADFVHNGISLDIKSTKPTGAYLIWPMGKRSKFWSLCAPYLALALVDVEHGRGEAVGFISRERFHREMIIAGPRHPLAEGTWHVHKSVLSPMSLLLKGDEMRVALAERTRGRWTSLLPLLGVDRTFLSGKHGPCIFCGGTDRWRYTNRDGSGDWICSQCGAGSGIELVKRFLKIDFKEAAQRVEALLRDPGLVPAEKAPPRRDDRREREEMRKLWGRALPLSIACPGGRYLRKERGLALTEFPSCLRFVADAPYDAERRHPAILCKVTSAQGKPINIHRIFITPMGRKTSLEPARKLMRGSLPPGAAVRLGRIGEGKEAALGIAEGVETALAAAQLFQMPVWSVLSAGGIERFVIPEGVEHLCIFGDNDQNYTGAKAAYVLASRAVVQSKINASVFIPSRDSDWNDVILRSGRAA